MPGAQVYLDTNVFITLGESNSVVQRALVDLVAEQTPGRPARLATSELTVAELLPKPHADKRDDLIDLYDAWIRDSAWLQVGPVTRDVLWYAGILRSNYRSLKLPDAIHLSTAIGFGCAYFLSTDEGIKDRYAITHSRYGMTTFSGQVIVARPDAATLQQMKIELNK